MRQTTRKTTTSSTSSSNNSSSSTAQHVGGGGSYYDAVPSSSSNSRSTKRHPHPRRLPLESLEGGENVVAVATSAAAAADFEDAVRESAGNGDADADDNNDIDESDCLMIHVRENDDDDNDDDQISSFVTAHAATSRSLSAALSAARMEYDEDDLRSIVVIQSDSIPWYQRNWLPDDPTLLLSAILNKHSPSGGGGQAGVALAEGPASVRFAKFVVISFAGIWIMYYLVRYLEWEHDPTLRLRDVWRYEGNLIFTDCMFYFIVGRLWQQRGIDHFQWLSILASSMLYSSAVTNFSMFRHAFTLYEMHCRWPWQLWLFCILALPVIVGVAVAHFVWSWRRGLVVQKCLEITFCLTFLLFPLVTSSYFHLHHWFAGFLVGMHCNYPDVWWSRATLAWCWGAYLNGIAVYGRDPVLTCEYALFMAVTQRCPFVACYIVAMNRTDHLDDWNHTVHEMKHPDWRNCSADAYHP